MKPEPAGMQALFQSEVKLCGQAVDITHQSLSVRQAVKVEVVMKDGEHALIRLLRNCRAVNHPR